MPCKKILQAPLAQTIASVTAGTKMSFPLPMGFRLHRIDLVYIDGGSSPNAVTAVFGDIEIQKNSKTVRIHAGTELDHMNGINGTQYLAANLTTNGTGVNERQCLPIFLHEPWRKNIKDADSLAWNIDPSWGWNSFTLNITPLINIPSTATLQIWLYVDALLANPKPGAPQNVKQIIRLDLPASGTVNDYSQFPIGWGYQALYFISPTGAYLQYATVKIDGVTFRDRVGNFDNIAAMEGAGLLPGTSTSAAGYGYDMVFDYDDPLVNLVVPSQSMWLHAEFSASASGKMRTLCDVFGPLAN